MRPVVRFHFSVPRYKFHSSVCGQFPVFPSRSSRIDLSMASQLQKDLANLWVEYKKKPIKFNKFNKALQIGLEELFHVKKWPGLSSETQIQTKISCFKRTTATNDAKLMEWKSSDNLRAEVIVNELKAKGLSLNWWVTFYLILILVESGLKEMRPVGIRLKNLRPDK